MQKISRQSTAINFQIESPLKAIPKAIYTKFEDLLLKDPLIPFAFLSVANRDDLDLDNDFCGERPRRLLYDCVVSFTAYNSSLHPQL